MSEQKEQPKRFKVLERDKELRRQLDVLYLRDANMSPVRREEGRRNVEAINRSEAELANTEGLVEVAEAVQALQAASAELRGLLDRWAVAVQGFANQLAVVEQRVAALTLAADAMEDNLADERALNCRDRLHALESKMTDVESRRP